MTELNIAKLKHDGAQHALLAALDGRLYSASRSLHLAKTNVRTHFLQGIGDLKQEIADSELLYAEFVRGEPEKKIEVRNE